MRLETIKDLDKLMVLCRKRGIRTFKVDNLEFTLEDMPEKQPRQSKVVSTNGLEPLTASDNAKITTDGWDNLSDEDKLFYSASGQVPTSAQ